MMTGGRSVKVAASPLVLALLALLAQGLAQVPSVGNRRLERVLHEKRSAELDTIFEINKPLIFNEYSRATFLVEADIMSPLTRNAIANLGFKWAKSEDGNVYIPYEMYNRYEPEQQRVIQEAMNEFNYRTCVRFVPRDNEADYLAFYPVMGCYSLMGHHRGMQIVSLDERCLQKGIIQHELLHSLGFWHEQARSDRDQFVSVQWDDIIPGYEHNFNKEQTNNLDTPYDYGSLLHYNRFAFTKNRRPTLVPTPETNVTLGQREKLSDQDVYKVNRFYACRKHLEENKMDKNVTTSTSNSSSSHIEITIGNDNAALTTPPRNVSDSTGSSVSDSVGSSALPVNVATSEYASQPLSPPGGTPSQVLLSSTMITSLTTIPSSATIPSSTTAGLDESAATETTCSQDVTSLPVPAGHVTGTATAKNTTAMITSSASKISLSDPSPSTRSAHDTASQSAVPQTTELPGVEDTAKPDATMLPVDSFGSTDYATGRTTLKSHPIARPATTTSGDQQPLTTNGRTQPTTPPGHRVTGRTRNFSLRHLLPRSAPLAVLDEALCEFETSSQCPWAQSIADDFDWMLALGSTPSWNTGPRADHTLGRCGTRTGHYLYTEASYPREDGQTAVLTSPLFRGPKCMTFWYHMRGASMGTLSVRLESTDGTDRPVLWSASGDRGNAWLYAELGIFVPPRQLFKLHLEGVLGSGFQGDAAVDDVLVSCGSCGKARQWQQQRRPGCDGDSRP
ncbi:astacin-like metalloendopeptidase isoform X2 [Petromyzon marinus]|uniref:Metalloendopeptidase n=1 Tax=Petromyzon marinus TaxID=7757 RepID=A0AAJ7T0T5_PETMA|nr:uncharacterized protein LOC116941275 isoform X2 [Petromyzon marinus]